MFCCASETLQPPTVQALVHWRLAFVISIALLPCALEAFRGFKRPFPQECSARPSLNSSDINACPCPEQRQPVQRLSCQGGRCLSIRQATVAGVARASTSAAVLAVERAVVWASKCSSVGDFSNNFDTVPVSFIRQRHRRGSCVAQW